MVTKTVSFEVPFAQLSSVSDRLFAAIETHVKCGRLLEAGDRVRVAEENLKLIKPALLWEKVGVVVLDYPHTAAAAAIGRIAGGERGWCSTVTAKNDHDDEGDGGEQRWLSKSFHLRVPTTTTPDDDDDSSDEASDSGAGGGCDRVMEIHWLTRPSPADTLKEREPTLALSQPAPNGVSGGEDEVAVALINAISISAPSFDARSWRAVPITTTTTNTTPDPDRGGTTGTIDNAGRSDGMQSSNEPVSINPRDTPELVPLALALGSTVGTAIALGLAQRRRQQQQQQQQHSHRPS